MKFFEKPEESSQDLNLEDLGARIKEANLPSAVERIAVSELDVLRKIGPA